MVYAVDSKSTTRKGLRVRVSPPAPPVPVGDSTNGAPPKVSEHPSLRFRTRGGLMGLADCGRAVGA
jgi:hypothetical protein